MSDQNSILSEWHGVIVGHIAFTEEINYYQPWRLDPLKQDHSYSVNLVAMLWHLSMQKPTGWPTCYKAYSRLCCQCRNFMTYGCIPNSHELTTDFSCFLKKWHSKKFLDHSQCLELGMVFEGTTGVYERVYCFNSKWVRKKGKYENLKWTWRTFLFAL